MLQSETIYHFLKLFFKDGSWGNLKNRHTGVYASYIYHFNLLFFAGRERTDSRTSFAVSFHLLPARQICTLCLRSSMMGERTEIDQLDQSFSRSFIRIHIPSGLSCLSGIALYVEIKLTGLSRWINRNSPLCYPALGAAYGTAKSGTGIAAMSVMRPELIMKSIIPVVMAGIIAIYGLVVAVLIANNISERVTLYK